MAPTAYLNQALDAQGVKGKVKSDDQTLPVNRDCLLKEYELKFSYLTALSTRVLTAISAHMVFVGACLVVVLEDNATMAYTYAIAAINVATGAFAAVWIVQLGKRHTNAMERLSEIALVLGIKGYHENSKEKITHFAFPFLFGTFWFLGTVIFWLVLCFMKS